jgi:hypothetical protein
MRRITSKNGPPTLRKLHLPLQPRTSGVCPERHCRIEWESCIRWFASLGQNPLGECRLRMGLRESNYFCKKCDCKTLHWQFSDKRHCDSCGHKPMDHVCFWNTEVSGSVNARLMIDPYPDRKVWDRKRRAWPYCIQEAQDSSGSYDVEVSCNI